MKTVRRATTRARFSSTIKLQLSAETVEKSLFGDFDVCKYQLLLHAKVLSCQDHKLSRNIIRKIREELPISKTELARTAEVSPLTISRIEQGKPCRMETKRKIILALGYDISDKDMFFPDR